MEDSYRDTRERENNKFIQPNLLKGIITFVRYDTWTADVQLTGAGLTILKKVPISLALGKDDIQVGDRCKLDVFDINNPDDCVVAYTYGRARYKRSNGGSITLSPSITQIAHGLGRTPDIVVLNGPGGTPVYILGSVDENYLYISANGSPGSQSGYTWFAALID